LQTLGEETSAVDLRRVQKETSSKLRAPLATMSTKRINPLGITDTAHALSSFWKNFPPLKKDFTLCDFTK